MRQEIQHDVRDFLRDLRAPPAGCMECGPAEGLSMRFYMWEGKNDCIFRDKMIWYRE